MESWRKEVGRLKENDEYSLKFALYQELKKDLLRTLSIQVKKHNYFNEKGLQDYFLIADAAFEDAKVQLENNP